MDPAASTMNAPPLALRLWNLIPAALRAILVGFAVLLFGGFVSGALMIANLRLAPSIPLFLPATALWLWLYWRLLAGAGGPRDSREWRARELRAQSLSPGAWLWALVCGGLGVTAAMGIAFVTYRFAPLPDAAYRAPFDVSGFPAWTLAAIFASLALTAGVVEEAAFRGYMLSGIERRHGWVAGIVTVTVVFYLAHRSHTYATIAFLPFFLVHGMVFGGLVYATRSIVPGIVLHAVSDFVVLPMQYGVVPSAGRWPFVSEGWLSLVAGAAALVTFRKLVAISRATPASTP